LGISYRIDKHQDSYTEQNENGLQIKDSSLRKYNKRQNNGFFARILRVFKKKPKRRRTRKRKRN